MNIELKRFTITRTPQTIAHEDVKKIALSIYPDDNNSKFTSELIKTKYGSKEFEILLENQISQEPDEELQNAFGILIVFYNWICSKSYPIKKNEIKGYLEKHFEKAIIKSNLDFESMPRKVLNSIQQKVADRMVCNIHTEGHPNFGGIKYDLFIKVIYIFKNCLDTTRKNHSLYTLNTSETIVNSILEQSILIPKGLIKQRCNSDSKPVTIYQPNRNNDCSCKGSKENANHCICLKPYVADLLVVKESLQRYEIGDVAHIENVLAGEEKVRKHRQLNRSEDYSEREEELSSYEERDNQVSEKFSLKNEVQKTVESELGIDAGVTYNKKYGKSISLTATANFSGNISKSSSQSTAKNYARDVVNRSVSKIEEKTRSLRTRKLINELEEQNKHKILNGTDTHMSGIYYWVNKVTRAQIFNYGKHMMFDVYVSEPAALYKKLFELKENKENARKRPAKPTDLDLDFQSSNITRNNYTKLIKEHGVVQAPPPPDSKTHVQFSFNHAVDTTGNEVSFREIKATPQIPDGYYAKKLYYSIDCYVANPNQSKGEDDDVSITVTFGHRILMHHQITEHNGGNHEEKHWEKDNRTIALHRAEGIMSLSVAGYSSIALAIGGSLSIECLLKEEKFEEWQLKIYDLIMNEYLRKLKAYENYVESEPNSIQIKGRNPFLNREIERNELKRQIISILLCDYFTGIGSMVDERECEYPEMDFDKLEKDSNFIRFFEQVFDWNYMTYLFYSGMWARKCKWDELLEEDSGDPLFDKFLTSGASRVQVPIREGMEQLFCYFLKTGYIWDFSGQPPVFGDDTYISLIQEIKESKQGDYSIRSGNVIKGVSNTVILQGSLFYFDQINSLVNDLIINNDIGREILIDYKIYRILSIEQDTSDIAYTTWIITLDREFEGDENMTFQHSVGAIFWGTPWEVFVPTKLIYLKNENDQLPTY